MRALGGTAVACSVLAALGIGMGGTATAADDPSPLCAPRSEPVPQGPAEFVSEAEVGGSDGRMRRITLRSPGLASESTTNVLLPENYDASGATRYPVLYLLHGGIGSYDDWRWNGVQGIVDQVSEAEGLPPFITVMPDGGHWGFYSDWYGTDKAASQPDPPPAWSKYHVGELVPWVDANFPTIASREGRAVAGLSMGGFGAMSYAARHPDVFSVAGSFSGAVHPNLDYPTGNAFLTGASLYFDQGNLRNCVWGDMVTQRVHWQDHDPTYLAENLGLTSLYIASGGGDERLPAGLVSDPVEETCFRMSRALSDALGAEGIEHTLDFYGSGTHTWEYWLSDLRKFLPLMTAAWTDPPPSAADEPFDYRSAQPRFEVWDWSFETDRDATEFTYLDEVSEDGLEVSGSGTLSVRTAPLYEPGTEYDVSFRLGTVPKRKLVRAGTNGRLEFDIDLGPAHGSQQQRFDAQEVDTWEHVEVTIEAAAP
jgi:S-formylglutathione hydrolase FrmB